MFVDPSRASSFGASLPTLQAGSKDPPGTEATNRGCAACDECDALWRVHAVSNMGRRCSQKKALAAPAESKSGYSKFNFR